MKNILFLLFLFITPVCTVSMVVSRPAITPEHREVKYLVAKPPAESKYRKGIRHIITGLAIGVLGGGAIAWAVLGNLGSLAMFIGLLGGLAVGQAAYCC